MKKKIALINPPWIEQNKFGIRAGSRWPYMVLKLSDGDTIPYPFFLGYATALLKKNGVSVALYDAIARGDSIEEFFEKLYFLKPDIIFLETSTPSFNYDISLLKKIKELFPKIILIIGGTHAAIYPELLKKYCFIDYLISGEYEEVLVDLVDALSSDNIDKITDIKGLAFIDKKENSVIINPAQKPVDINQLPFPERNEDIYKYNEMLAPVRPNVSLMATRGCAYCCNFSLWPQTLYKNNLYRKRNVLSVVEEISYLKNNFNFQFFYFDDDSINLDSNFFNNLCNAIISEKLNIRWGCMGNINTIDATMLRNMADSGCEFIKLGVESGVDIILCSIKNGITRAKIIEKLMLFKNFNIKRHLTFSIGHSEETEETLKQTLDLIDLIKPESLQISYLTPFPGTRLYDGLNLEDKKELSFNGFEITKSFCKTDINTLKKYYHLILERAEKYRVK